MSAKINKNEIAYIYVYFNDLTVLMGRCKVGKTTNILGRYVDYKWNGIVGGFVLVIEVPADKVDDLELFIHYEFRDIRLFTVRNRGTEFFKWEIKYRLFKFIQSFDITCRKLSTEEIQSLITSEFAKKKLERTDSEKKKAESQKKRAGDRTAFGIDFIRHLRNKKQNFDDMSDCEKFWAYVAYSGEESKILKSEVGSACIYIRKNQTGVAHGVCKLGRTRNLASRHTKFTKFEFFGKFIMVIRVPDGLLLAIECFLKYKFKNSAVFRNDGKATEFFNISIIDRLLEVIVSLNIEYEVLDKEEIYNLSGQKRRLSKPEKKRLKKRLKKLLSQSGKSQARLGILFTKYLLKVHKVDRNSLSNPKLLYYYQFYKEYLRIQEGR